MIVIRWRERGLGWARNNITHTQNQTQNQTQIVYNEESDNLYKLGGTTKRPSLLTLASYNYLPVCIVHTYMYSTCMYSTVHTVPYVVTCKKRKSNDFILIEYKHRVSIHTLKKKRLFLIKGSGPG